MEDRRLDLHGQRPATLSAESQDQLRYKHVTQRTRFRWLSLAILGVFASILFETSAHSQTVVSTTPSNGERGVAVTLDSMSVKFDLVVDTTSYYANFPVGDTTIDSSLGGIYLVNREIFELVGFDRDLLSRLSRHLVLGNSAIDELHITIDSLETFDYGREYSLVVTGLRLIDTILLDTTIVYDYVAHFQIDHEAHRFMSMSGGRFKCGDTVLLPFNRKLDSCSTLLGPLVSLHQWEGFALNVDSTTAETSWNSVSPGYFLSQDSLSVCFLMDSLHNSGHLRLPSSKEA